MAILAILKMNVCAVFFGLNLLNINSNVLLTQLDDFEESDGVTSEGKDLFHHPGKWIPSAHQGSPGYFFFLLAEIGFHCKLTV